MDTLFIYLIKSSLSLAILFLVYKLFFRKEVYFRFSRLLLLSIMVIVIGLPLLPYNAGHIISSAPVPVGEIIAIPGLAQFTLDEVVIRAAGTASFPIADIPVGMIILIIYLAGVLFKTLQFLFRLTQIGLLIRKSETTEHNGFNFVFTEKGSPTYSFLNRIFIDPELFQDEDVLAGIIAHEKIHIEHGHTYDLIIAEIVIIIQWFNPFAWLLKKAIKENHEFIADGTVINHYHNANAYRMLLFNHSSIIKTNSLTHNFSYSLLKRRLKMMKKSKHPLRFTLGVLFLTSVFIVLFFACSRPEDRQAGIKPIKNQHTVVEIRPNQPGGMDSLKAFRDRYNKWPDEIRVVTMKGSNQQSTIVKTSGIRPDVTLPANDKADSIYTVAKKMPEFPGGVKALMTYLSENIKYPEQARNDSIQGRVFVSFVIEKDGRVSDVQVLRGIGGGCDEEAVRVISAMPDWKPGLNKKGEAVRVRYNLPVKYTLE